MLTEVKQNTWLTRQVPAHCKLVNVMSIHKKGQKDDLGNYRPVKPNLGFGQGYGRDHPQYHYTAHAGLFLNSNSKRNCTWLNNHYLTLLCLQSNYVVLTKQRFGVIQNRREKQTLPLHSRDKFNTLSAFYRNIWLMLQETPDFSLTKACPSPLCKTHPFTLKIHLPCPNPKRPAILQDRTVTGTWQKSPHQTCFSKKLRASEKTFNLTATLQPLGFHSLQTKQPEKGWKITSPLPLRKAKWWIIFCP